MTFAAAKPSGRTDTGPLWPAVLLAVVLAGLAGCEKRVISTRMVPETGMIRTPAYRYVPVEKPQPRSRQGLLEKTGDLLFGWTGQLFGKSSATKKPAGPPARRPSTFWTTAAQSDRNKPLPLGTPH